MRAVTRTLISAIGQKILFSIKVYINQVWVLTSAIQGAYRESKGSIQRLSDYNAKFDESEKVQLMTGDFAQFHEPEKPLTVKNAEVTLREKYVLYVTSCLAPIRGSYFSLRLK